jgi:hypothetical protein
VQIKPLEGIDLRHVKTGERLPVKAVVMPGYRCLAEVELPNGHPGFADLPLGNHVYHPQVWDRQTNEVVSNTNFLWTDIREEQERTFDQPEHWRILTKKVVRKAFVLNCLDFVYGHCLSRLLNYSIDYATRFPGMDCILMIPQQLAHLAPEGCAEIWIYSGPLKHLRSRNLWLERAFAELYARMDELYLSPCPLHIPDRINPSDFGLRPAKIDAPAIVVSYRENRAWGGNIYNQQVRLEKLGQRLAGIWPREQLFLVGVAGKSAAWKWKNWNSLLVAKPTLADEQAMLTKLSDAVITIGCQGSNMLLPCMLSWSTIRLLPLDRLSHFLGGDYVGRAGSQQMETLYKSRILYGGDELRDLDPDTVFAITKSMLEYREFLQARFINPMITEEDIRHAARTLPSEEKLASEFTKPKERTFGERARAQWRKIQTRFDKTVGRLRVK